MKVKKAFLICCMIVLPYVLTGCGFTGEIFKEVVNEVKEEMNSTEAHESTDGQEQVFDTPPLNKEEYVEYIGLYQEQLKEEFFELSRLLHDESMDDYVQANRNQIEKITTIINQYRALHAPDDFYDVHFDYMVAMDYFESGLQSFEQGLVSEDDRAIEEGLFDLEQGQNYWNYAFAVLGLTEAIPMGDGTITSQDLKELDQLAGMDRDSVLLNLSITGEELVGHWGFENEDGSFNTSIILHEDGKYEGYSNGVYPDDNNVMKGYWLYHHLTRTLHVYTDLMLEDGESIPVPRPEMVMDVQLFKDDQILMMDVETLNSFFYTKGE